MAPLCLNMHYHKTPASGMKGLKITNVLLILCPTSLLSIITMELGKLKVNLLIVVYEGNCGTVANKQNRLTYN